MSGLSWFLALAWLSVSFRNAAPQGEQRKDPLETKASAIQLEDETVIDAFAKLNAQIELSMSVELILKDKLSDPNITYPRFNLRVDGGSVREVLDRVCALDGRFAWSRYKDTINIYPKLSLAAGDGYFLNRRLSDTQIKELSDPAQAVFQTVAHLPGTLEQIAFSQTGGAPGFPRPLDLTLNDLTVRQAFDEIAEHLGKGHGWTLYGTKEFRVIRFHAKLLPEPRPGPPVTQYH